MDKHLKVAVAGLVTALTITGAAASPAQAVRPADKAPKQIPVNIDTYSALGDSFASGFGSGMPIDGSGRTLQAYPVLLAGQVTDVNFLAESGADTAEMADQIAMVPPSAKQVTVTIGGNDLNAMGIANGCLIAPLGCLASISYATSELPTLKESVSAAIGDIHEQAPRATIYVTGYPELFQAADTTDPYVEQCFIGTSTTPLGTESFGVPVFLTDAVDGLTTGINGAIATSVADHSDYATYVDVSDEFADHGLCGTSTSNPDSYINPVALNNGEVVPVPVPIHPNAYGQQAYADAIREAGFGTRS